MKFLTKKDFKAVCDPTTLAVIDQADDDNLARAEGFAIEEISSYLRSRFDIASAYNESYTETTRDTEDDDNPIVEINDTRNHQLVMVTCDVALYHLISWLPKRIGFDIREIRYNRAIEWLVAAQAGKVTPDLPSLTDARGNDIGNPIRFDGMTKAQYDY